MRTDQTGDKDDNRTEDRTVRRLRPKRRISPLTFRILAVNLIALGFLAGGILYIDQYQETMIRSRIEALVKDARVMAGALGEAATITTDRTKLRRKPAEQIIARVVGVTKNRTRLFGLDGKLWLDSRDLAINQSVTIDKLPLQTDWQNFWDAAAHKMLGMLDHLHRQKILELYHEVRQQTARHYPEVSAALKGDTGYRIRRLSDGADIITVATPVQRFRRVLGAVMLSADTRDIRQAVQHTRMTFLRFFGIVLLVTLLLSLFLARTIVRPILRLASAADRISAGTHTGADIPDYSSRNDEVGDLSRSLKDMTLALARQIDAVAAFAADVSHELKNPLTSLRSAVETLPVAQSGAAKDKLWAIIGDDIGRLDRLINDISNASRLDAEISHTPMAEVNLKSLLETLIDVYQSSQGSKIPTLQLLCIPSTKKSDRVFCVQGLEGQLGQLFHNLIDNAISFSQQDGKIQIELRQSRAMIQVTIEDDGPGIPEHKLEDIFNRFYSERPRQEAFGKHSGLGLSICKQITESHGGVIIAKNRKRGGACFIVQLPYKAQPTS